MKKIRSVYIIIVIGALLINTNCIEKDKSKTKTIVVSQSNETIYDIDGNLYETVRVGDQVWMAENLRTTKYSNGDSIPNVTDDFTWTNLTFGAYCNYKNDTNNSTSIGILYNWDAINDSRNIAPSGWHVPTKSEWETLINYLEDKTLVISNLKSSSGWGEAKNGTNKSGFAAKPNQGRGLNGKFTNNVGSIGTWWSSSEYDTDRAWFYFITEEGYGYNGNKKLGLPVRCIKDIKNPDSKEETKGLSSHVQMQSNDDLKQLEFLVLKKGTIKKGMVSDDFVKIISNKEIINQIVETDPSNPNSLIVRKDCKVDGIEFSVTLARNPDPGPYRIISILSKNSSE